MDKNAKKRTVVEQAVDFEGMKLILIKKSAQRGWLIAWIFGGAWLLTLITLCFLIPLKKTVPFVIAVDQHGNRDIITELNNEVITANEALVKHDIYDYVKLRESYNWETLAKDYTLVQLFSSPQVNFEYGQIYDPEIGLQTKLSSKYRIDVEVKTIVLSTSNSNNVATVRIRTNTYLLKTGELSKVENKIITLTYNYDANKKLKTSSRLENPLGFTITSYRFDEELS